MPISCQSMTVTAYASCEIDGMNFVGLDTLSQFHFSATAYGARFTNITLNMEIPLHTALVVNIPQIVNYLIFSDLEFCSNIRQLVFQVFCCNWVFQCCRKVT